jgi:ketosteroid isomerase-like protein
MKGAKNGFPILGTGLLLLLFGSSSLPASDVDDLKASFEGALESLNSRNLKDFRKAWHPQAVLFSRNRLMPFDLNEIGQEEWFRIFSGLFGEARELHYTAYSMQYRVLGDVGLVWGLTGLTLQLDDQPSEEQDVRLTATFFKTSDGWKIVSWHDSSFPE